MKNSAKLLLMCALLVPCLGCARGSHDGTALGSDGTSSISARLTLPDGEVIETVQYVLTSGSTGAVRSGTVTVGDRMSIAFLIGGVPAGDGYGLSISSSAGGGTRCSGHADGLSVRAHVTTSVALNMACYAPGTDAGNVLVDTTPFNCGTWTSLATGIGGAEANLGGSITLLAAATGPDPTGLTYAWTSSLAIGTFGRSEAKAGTDVVTFTCTAPGTTTISLVVGDGRIPKGASCDPAQSTVTTAVTCDAAAPFTLTTGSSSVLRNSVALKNGSAQSLSESSPDHQHQLVTVADSMGQPVLKEETWTTSAGAIPLMTLETFAPHVLLQLSSADSHTFNGTLNGTSLKEFATSAVMDLANNGGFLYADGSPVMLTAQDTQAQQVIRDAFEALGRVPGQAAPPPVSALGFPSASADPPLPGLPAGDPPPYTPAPATEDNVLSSSTCSNCTSTALETFFVCEASQALAAVGCGVFYDLCLAAGIATICLPTWGTQNEACYTQGAACCPTACGSQGCCLAGRTCMSGGSGTPALCCGGRACGTGCCNEPDDQCFQSNEPSNPFQCCPAGQPIFTRTDGSQICCHVGDHLDPTTGQCCSQPDGCGSCGLAGQTCCGFGRCSEAGTGCDAASNTCVACPPTPIAAPIESHTDVFSGMNCGSPRDEVLHFGAACPPGVRPAFLTATSAIQDSDTTCTASWDPADSSDPSICKFQVVYHLPADCLTRTVSCDVQAFGTTGALPPTALRAELQRDDGQTLDGEHHFRIGGPCDPGYVQGPPPTPIVLPGSDPGLSCSAQWHSSDPADCTVDITYRLGNLNTRIGCDTKAIEVLASAPPAPPTGCM